MVQADLAGHKTRLAAQETERPAQSRKQAPAAEKRLHLEISSPAVGSRTPPPPKAPGKRGRPARGKALNLLDRFGARPGEIMAFLESDAPFDNKHAERDLRMMKTRQKISGCFRSPEVLESLAGLRSVISTAAKHSVKALSAIKALFVPAPILIR